jgi:hypothetical protein
MFATLVVVATGAGLIALVWLTAPYTDHTTKVASWVTHGAATGVAVKKPSLGAVLHSDAGSSRDDLAASAILPTRDAQASDAAGSRVAAPAKAIPGEAGRNSGQSTEVAGGRTPQVPSTQVIPLPAFAAGGAPANGGAASGVPEMVIEVPAGEKVPAVFYEVEPKPAPQQKMLDRIAAQFNETVANPPPGVPDQQVWEDARRRADEQYLQLYGHAAYNARHLQAAREAVREKRALEAAGRPVDAAVSDPGAP